MNPAQAAAPAPAPFGPGRIPALRRWSLWALLIALVAALLVTLVWLAGRYEASQVQSKLERDTADALGDIRGALTRNVQTLQALQAGHPSPASWSGEADRLLREHREWVRIEWRGAALATLAAVDTPFRSPVYARLGRANAQADVA
ncbi:MAG: PAS domain-containing sensor histidine kinase, partial [Ramlibacter sp.]|nr:PAS domain-containing sensor histidine kinase [Ramlibacter sp.]